MKLIKFRVCSGNRSGSTYAEVSSSTQTNAINKLSFIIATQHGNTNKSKIVKKQTNTNMLKLRITTLVCIELNRLQVLKGNEIKVAFALSLSSSKNYTEPSLHKWK